MLWVKVELVDSVDELRSSSSTRGISMPNFEVLDARIASALNKIIQNSQFKRRISLEEQKAQKEDRFRRGRQIAYLIYDHFRVTGTHDSVENYTDLFTIVLRNDDIQKFDSRKEGPPCIWDTHGTSGNVFANPHASSSAPYPQELNPWETTIEEPRHMSTAEKSERLEHNRDLRCQFGPSTKDSVIFSGGDSSKNYGADQQRLQISDLHFDKFPTPATFACWKIRFKTEVCTCSQFPTEAMQWIKEVELVDSVDELRFSSLTRGISNAEF